MENLYQNPPSIGENPIEESIELLTEAVDEINTKIDYFAKQHQTFNNVVFIGDSFGAGYFYGYDPSTADVNNYQYRTAELLKIPAENFRRYNKGGLCFNQVSENNLWDFLRGTILPAEAQTRALVDCVVLCLGVNDSVLNNRANTRAGIEKCVPQILKQFPNAVVHYFYSPVVSLREARSVAIIRNAMTYINNTERFATHFASVAYNTGDTSLYTKGGEDTVYHPNAAGAKVIAGYMATELTGFEVNPEHIWFFSANHESSVAKPFNIRGGGYITVTKNGVEIFGTINTFKQATYNLKYVVMDTDISEFFRGTSHVINIGTYDTALELPLGYAFNFDNGEIKLCIPNTMTFPDIVYSSPSAFFGWSAYHEMA